MAGLLLLLMTAGAMPQTGASPAPSRAAVLMQAGRESLKANRIEEAGARFAEAAQQDPTLPDAHYYLGVVREQQRDLPGAAAEYRRALSLSPLPTAHDRLGFVLGQQGQTDAAIAEFERAIALDPTLADAQYHLGATRWWIKQPQA